MLKLMLTCSSLLLLTKTTTSWIYASSTLVILTLVASLNLPLNSFILSISPFSMLDSMSSSLILLTMWITALMLIASLKIKITKLMDQSFFVMIMSLLMILMLSFSTSNLLIFYIWFEASLIPTMLLIMYWGYQPERIQASMYLMIYTVTASLPLLAMIMSIMYSSSHLSMLMSWSLMITPSTLTPILWFMLITAFMVKLPLFTVHLWLPKAHVEAPVAGSMILAAILLKLGGYGLLRITSMFPSHNQLLSSIMMSIALVGAITTSLICLRQSDLKALIAYSSVGHMGILVAGTMSNSKLGFYGSLGMMIAHGLTSSALFCMANISYEMTHTRSMSLTKGIMSMMPSMSLLWFMFICANMAAPPSINLLSEIMLITASSFYSLIMTIMFMLTSFFTAAYSLFLYSSINHGAAIKITNPMTHIKPSYMILAITHMWPIITMIALPVSVTSWC